MREEQAGRRRLSFTARLSYGAGALATAGMLACLASLTPGSGQEPAGWSIAQAAETLLPTPSETASEPVTDPTPSAEVTSQSPTPEATLNPPTGTSTTPTATSEPSVQPSVTPTTEPTTEPTAEPTAQPTVAPTVAPTEEPEPTVAPTSQPTSEPTSQPTVAPPVPTSTGNPDQPVPTQEPAPTSQPTSAVPLPPVTTPSTSAPAARPSSPVTSAPDQDDGYRFSIEGRTGSNSEQSASPSQRAEGGYDSVGIGGENNSSVPGTEDWVSSFLNSGIGSQNGANAGVANADDDSAQASTGTGFGASMRGDNIIAGIAPLLVFTLLTLGGIIGVIIFYRRRNSSF